ncbi:MAG: methyltransferase domain-containing protein, partial [Ktedonobacteraceae bacterium]
MVAYTDIVRRASSIEIVRSAASTEVARRARASSAAHYARKFAEKGIGALFSLDREFIAKTYISGNGIEIGALHRRLRVPKKARVKYVDRWSVPELREQCPELRFYWLPRVDIIDNGEQLKTIGDSTQDFVIANHFLEHCQNPIGAISNMLRVIKQGGVIYLAIPDKR